MRLNMTTNSLLAVIAACLILITLKDYGLDVTGKAYGQSSNLILGAGGQELLPAALYGKYAGGMWHPVQVNGYHKLVVEVEK